MLLNSALISLFLSTPSARRATPSTSCDRHSKSNFYPRPPRGGRPRRAPRRQQPGAISIHALREEGDRYFSWSFS